MGMMGLQKTEKLRLNVPQGAGPGAQFPIAVPRTDVLPQGADLEKDLEMAKGLKTSQMQAKNAADRLSRQCRKDNAVYARVKKAILDLTEARQKGKPNG